MSRTDICNHVTELHTCVLTQVWRNLICILIHQKFIFLNAPGLPLQTWQTNPREGFLCFSDLTSYHGVTSFKMGGGGAAFNIKPFYFCRTLIHIHVALLVMLFAECSTDLMNTSISGKQENMKEKHSPHCTVSNFNYLSGECVFTCLSKQIWPPVMSEYRRTLHICRHPCHGSIGTPCTLNSLWLFWEWVATWLKDVAHHCCSNVASQKSPWG